MFILGLLLSLLLQPPQASIVCLVTAGGVPVADAEVVVAGQTYRTDAAGVVRIALPAGTAEISVVKSGFVPATAAVTLAPETEQRVAFALEAVPVVEETVTVTATRTGRGIEDQPMRVEVLDQDEIDEKLMMTPGDIVMMLNEMGGMRVQATSPSLGAASVRIQGMRGRDTRFLSDGLPLYGQQVSLGLMQIPPLDLGRAEVIKGMASSLYGAGAIGGVVNLVSRRPGSAPERRLLLNRSSRGATDADVWYSAPLSDTWGLTLLATMNGQRRTDVDDDGWADLPRYARAVVRPRLFFDNHKGTTFFATLGGTWEDRIGGSVPGSALTTTGQPYVEALDTRRADVGALFQSVIGNAVWSARGSWSAQRQDHTFGETAEHDDSSTGFGEATLRRRLGQHTLVGGVAVERDHYVPRGLPQFAYTYTVPGVFAQDDIDVGRWLVLSASGRVDRHSQFGTFFSPRLAALLKHGPWSVRLSGGSGFSAPTPNNEETGAAGLSRLVVPAPLRVEEGSGGSIDLTRAAGPLSTTLTLFQSRVRSPAEVEWTEQFVLTNLPDPTTVHGVEALTVWKTDAFSFVANYTFVSSQETTNDGRVAVPLTPRHSLGLDAAWQFEKAGHIGLEWYYTGTQRLENNPYRPASRPYSVFGALAVHRLTNRIELFVNGENLTNVRQSQWDPVIRPTRSVDGRWAVDAWAPLDGRNINGGVRLSF